MGAAAFLMANTVGCSCWEVCIAAIIPTMLYYVTLFFGYLKVALPIWRRVLWSIAGLLLILPGLTTSIPGLVLMVLLVVTDKHLLHREKEKDALKPVL